MSREVLRNLLKSADELSDLYKTAGKDIHSEKWKRCVEHVKEQGNTDNPYAVCTASLGDESFKDLAKSDDLTPEDIAKINCTILEKASEDLMALSASEPDEDEDEDLLEKARQVSGENYIVTPTINELYGQSPMPKPMWLDDPLAFRGRGEI